MTLVEPHMQRRLDSMGWNEVKEEDEACLKTWGWKSLGKKMQKGILSSVLELNSSRLYKPPCIKSDTTS